MAEDPEVERRLEAMFSSARPRAGFEEELWRRIEARAPWHRRWLGWLTSPPVARLAPALAGLVVVVLGASWLIQNLRLPLSGGGASTTSSALAPAAPSFGVLPRAPGLIAAKSAAGQVAPAASSAPNFDQGPSQLVFTGALPPVPKELPVYRYDEPSAADLQSIAATRSARYGSRVTVTGSDPRRGLEPRLSAARPGLSPGTEGLAAAAGINLRTAGLLPSNRFSEEMIVVTPDGVIFPSVLQGPEGPAVEVDADGHPVGLTVEVSGGLLTGISGPLDLPLAFAIYPGPSSAAAALNAAGVGQGPAAGGARTFDTARLVYLLAIKDSHGYYEPELLLSGATGSVLVPLIAQQWLGP